MKDIKINNMKKTINKLIYSFAILSLIFSCDDVERVYYNDSAETLLSLSDDNIVLDENLFIFDYPL